MQVKYRVSCTIDRLSTILVVIEDGPKTTSTSLCRHKAQFWISWSREMTCVSTSGFDVCLQVHSVAFMCHRRWQSAAGKPIPFHDIVTKIVSMFSTLTICADLAPTLHKFLIPEVLLDYGIRRPTAHVQLFGYVSDSNPSVLLDQSINSSNIVRRSW